MSNPYKYVRKYRMEDREFARKVLMDLWLKEHDAKISEIEKDEYGMFICKVVNRDIGAVCEEKIYLPNYLLNI